MHRRVSQGWSILARHSASKVSEFVASACASSGSLNCRVGALAGSGWGVDDWAACAGHSSKDFESIGLPSYQHLRPSMIRHDQYPCRVDGFEALHCCFANTLVSGIEKSVTANTARTPKKTYFVMTHLKFNFDTAIDVRASLSICAIGRSLLLARANSVRSGSRHFFVLSPHILFQNAPFPR